MRPSITLAFAVAALGTALASAPALAQPTKQKVLHQPTDSAASPASLSPSAPVSPGGIGASPNMYGGGPGFVGEVHGTTGKATAYNATASKGAPVSPGGIGASPNSFNGGPGYSGDVAANVSSSGGKPVAYSGSAGGISTSPTVVGPGQQ
jgi:hypothetical protein